MLVYMHMDMDMDMDMNMCSCMYVYTCTCVCVCMHVNACICVRACVRAHDVYALAGGRAASLREGIERGAAWKHRAFEHVSALLRLRVRGKVSCYFARHLWSAVDLILREAWKCWVEARRRAGGWGHGWERE